LSIIRKLLNPAVLAMQAYKVPSAQKLVKLDAMENPYGWPDDVIADWLSVLKHVAINRYPAGDAGLLREKLHLVMQLPEGMDVLLGNGSDELIQIIALAMARPDRVVMAPEPGFVMYRLISQLVNLQFQGLPLEPGDFSLERDKALAAIRQYQPSLVFIACPNNPTGNMFDRETIIAIIKAVPGLVVIDEAYHAFAGDSFMDCLSQYDNLLVMRTLSKSGLAGLRLGYLVGPPAWIEELNKIRLPYNINVLTQKSVEFILEHYDLLADQAENIRRDREKLFRQLQAMDDLTVWPSRANFLLFRCHDRSAASIHEGLEQHGILIKNLHGSQQGLDQCLRVTVGTPEENRCFVSALSELL